jgi:hypothetical protein
MQSEWLQERITVAEAEARHSYKHDERAKRYPELKNPFGLLNPQWEALKGKMCPGDEIWTFSSPTETWRKLIGRGGIALVRDGKVISTIITRMN